MEKHAKSDAVATAIADAAAVLWPLHLQLRTARHGHSRYNWHSRRKEILGRLVVDCLQKPAAEAREWAREITGAGGLQDQRR